MVGKTGSPENGVRMTINKTGEEYPLHFADISIRAFGAQITIGPDRLDQTVVRYRDRTGRNHI
jgi:hypothetical protein